MISAVLPKASGARFSRSRNARSSYASAAFVRPHDRPAIGLLQIMSAPAAEAAFRHVRRTARDRSSA
jgi:hypothetical protein